MTENLFVYGTLKRGFRNHKHMKKDGIQFSKEVRTTRKYPLYLDYTNRYRPCLAELEGVGYRVHGELYKVDKKMIPSLDDFERVPEHYHRGQVATVDKAGVECICNVYFNNTTEERAEELTRGSFLIIRDYTYYHHRRYVPRTLGNFRRAESKQLARNNSLFAASANGIHNGERSMIERSAVSTTRSAIMESDLTGDKQSIRRRIDTRRPRFFSSLKEEKMDPPNPPKASHVLFHVATGKPKPKALDFSAFTRRMRFLTDEPACSEQSPTEWTNGDSSDSADDDYNLQSLNDAYYESVTVSPTRKHSTTSNRSRGSQ